MNESMVTFQGWLGGDVRTRRAGDAVVASFRVASTPRRLNRSTGEWHDGPTQWYTVNAWRALGEHCASSLKRSDPVIVHGRLTQSTWVNQHGVEMTSLDVDASFVGHDLSRGTTVFTKAVGRDTRRQVADPAAERPAAEPDHTVDGSAEPQLAAAPEPRHWVA
jgi:single-strand DNA-binding protein